MLGALSRIGIKGERGDPRGHLGHWISSWEANNLKLPYKCKRLRGGSPHVSTT